MNLGMKARQFVNVVTEKKSGGLYSLRRIRASDLFYGSKEEALAKEAEQEEEGKNAMAAMNRSRLPKPRMRFNQSSPVDGRMDFWPFYGTIDGDTSSKILCVDAVGQAVLYDAGTVTLETLPRLRIPMGRESHLQAVALSVSLPDAHDPARPDTLYVMDQRSGGFEALVYGDPSPYLTGCWANAFTRRWRQLPMPPFVREPNHGSIKSYALLPADGAGGTICVSSMGDKVGTYCFNTASERWTKAGSWKLPFYGRAVVVPELNGLCFGVADRSPNHLCAVDLSSISMDDGDSARPPKLRHQWPVMADTPEAWTPTNIGMAYMGAGRFCIAKTFRDWRKYTGRSVDYETVLNGVEVVRENGAASKWTKSKLQLIRHKSFRYGLLNHRIHVL